MNRNEQKTAMPSASGTELRSLACRLAQAVASTTRTSTGPRPSPRRVKPNTSTGTTTSAMPIQGICPRPPSLAGLRHASTTMATPRRIISTDRMLGK